MLWHLWQSFLGGMSGLQLVAQHLDLSAHSPVCTDDIAFG